MRKAISILLIMHLLLLSRAVFAAQGGSMKVELPAGTKVTAAVAIASGLKLESPGKIEGPTIAFEQLLPETPYDIRLTLADGTTVQGVDLNWYTEEEAKAD